MKSLTVAIHTPVFPNMVQTYILSLIVALKNTGIETIIIARQADKDHSMPPDIAKYRLLENTIYIKTTYTGFIRELFTLPILDPDYQRIIKRILNSKSWRKYGWRYFLKEFIRAKSLVFREFDLIHSHTLTGSYDHLFMKDIFSKPIITTFHGKEPRSSRNLASDKAKMVFTYGDIFLVNTEYAKKELMNMGCLAKKIRILPQGTNLEDFPYSERSIDPNDRIVLMTVGRLSVEKGHHIAIEAVSNLSCSFPLLEYHIIGDGPEKTNLAVLISKLNMKSKIKLLGSIPTEQLHACYSGNHIFILPSINTKDGYHVETQGVVLQEAQASGLPVIASSTGGIPESIIDNKTGLLFKEAEPGDLADKIRQLIENSDLYMKMSHAGRQDVEERFNISSITQNMIDTYYSASRSSASSTNE